MEDLRSCGGSCTTKAGARGEEASGLELQPRPIGLPPAVLSSSCVSRCLLMTWRNRSPHALHNLLSMMVVECTHTTSEMHTHH
jgi:hypothetical protein